MNDNINFYKGAKLFVSFISGIVFFINVIYAHNLMGVASFVFVFIPSAMLSIYGMTPTVGKRKKQRRHVFYSLFGQFILLIASFLFIQHHFFPSIVLWVLKASLGLVTIIFLWYAVIDDTDYETPLEKRAVSQAKDNLNGISKQKRYKTRKQRKQYKHYIKGVLSKSKSKTSGNYDIDKK